MKIIIKNNSNLTKTLIDSKIRFYSGGKSFSNSRQNIINVGRGFAIFNGGYQFRDKGIADINKKRYSYDNNIRN